MAGNEDEILEMGIEDVEIGAMQDGYQAVALATTRGIVECRYYRAGDARRAVVSVGGVGGGWDTPAEALYPSLSRDLTREGISSLRVRFRHPTVLEEAILDVLGGLFFLQTEGIEVAGLVGHSFGGAVVIQAAAVAPVVRTVVTLATQGYGAEPVADLAPRCSVLLLHGKADEVLPSYSSEYVYRLAHEPKRLLLYEGARHGLDEVAGEVYHAVRGWLVEQLSRESG